MQCLAHEFVPYTEELKCSIYCLDPCELISTWLGYEYETTAVDSDNAPMSIVYECGDNAQFADDSSRKYASCDANRYWEPIMEQCLGIQLVHTVLSSEFRRCAQSCCAFYM